MASEVDICNMALANIRSAGINSLNEASLQGQYCKLKYPFIRDVVLREAPWKFSHVIDALAPLSDTVFNWAYVYQHPADCLYINKLILNQQQYVAGVSVPVGTYSPDLDRQVAYDVFNVGDNRVIVSNEPQLRISYRKRVTDPNLFDPSFVQSLVWLMSAELAVPIVGGEAGRGLRNDAIQMYRAHLASAAAANQNQKYSTPRDSEFVTVRN